MWSRCRRRCQQVNEHPSVSRHPDHSSSANCTKPSREGLNPPGKDNRSENCPYNWPHGALHSAGVTEKSRLYWKRGMWKYVPGWPVDRWSVVHFGLEWQILTAMIRLVNRFNLDSRDFVFPVLTTGESFCMCSYIKVRWITNMIKILSDYLLN